MYKRILVAYDGSESSDGALALAAHIASHLDVQLHIAHVIETSDHDSDPKGADQRAPERFDDAAAQRWRHQLEQAIGQLSIETPVERMVLAGPVAASLLELVDRYDIDLLVAGTHGVGHVKQALFGSVSHGLLRHASCDLLFLRAPVPHVETLSVTVGLDGSPASMRALSVGNDLASVLQSPLVLAHVAPTPPFADSVYISERTRAELIEQLRLHGHDLLERAREQVDDVSGPLVEERREGHVSAELLSICAEHAPTLLLVGARGSQGFAGLITGSTTRDMLDYAQGPVLVVRPPPGVEMQQASPV